MTVPEVTSQLALQLGLNEAEYQHILEILGRVPTYTELGMFSVMWSEHCSYKNSIAELKKLPRSGGRLLASAGEENAGLVDIGDGLAVAFKIESHNHPSSVEPYQGAATGVGGIMRDIFTMGARPIAALNSLRFGDPDDPQTHRYMKGIVAGIGDYGNSFGVPTVAGDVYFDKCYEVNPLVNAMAVGIVEHANIARAIAIGEGNLVMIVGSSTGRDGIHGATFASEEISEESDSKRPSVQVGDPFTEKLLLEATLEVIRAGYVVGIQDMGAAGITCSTSEMSAKGKSGMAIDLDKVPVRESNLTAYEILLSESQERMLLVISPANQLNVKRVFDKWDLSCEPIGVVTSDGRLRIKEHNILVADIPAESLVLGGGAPVYHPESREPEYIQAIRELDVNSLPEPTDYRECLKGLLASPNICSRKWIYTQYDRTVRTNTILDTDSDAAVIRLKGTRKALAVKTDCNPRYTYLNPYRGAQIAVAESARNVTCVGATPLAITNCLNFGNPNKPEVMWQFKEAIRGMADACRALSTPVTGGNVSFYNEGSGEPIYPTPVIGMLGEIEDIGKIVTAGFKQAGDIIMLLGKTSGHIGGSEYLKLSHNLIRGDAPEVDLQMERRLQSACLDLIKDGLVRSAHDISEGGLAVCLAECSIFSQNRGGPFGAHIEIGSDLRADLALFSEDQSRIVISTKQRDVSVVESVLDRHKVPHTILGEVTSNDFLIQELIQVGIEEISAVYSESLGSRMEASLIQR